MLRLGDESFALSDKVPGGLIYKIGEAEAEGNVTSMLQRYMQLMRRIVAPQDKERLEQFIDSDAFDDLDPDEIAKAITEAAGEVMGRPTVRPSPSQAGPPETAPTSRVVSLSRGTVEVQESQTA